MRAIRWSCRPFTKTDEFIHSITKPDPGSCPLVIRLGLNPISADR